MNDAVLAVRGLTKEYEDFALRDISFSLPPGYIMGLIGPNGAGKTTIIKCILDLAKRSAGDVRIFGEDNRHRAGAVLRQRIGFVQDAPTFYGHLTLQQMKGVIAPFYERWDEGRFQGLAAEFALPLDRKVDAVSRGTLMRFAICLSLSHHAELIIMDEPTTGLDPAMRRRFLEVLADVIGGGTTSVLFSTHITTDLERTADFITFVQGGQLKIYADHDEIRENWGIVKGSHEALDDDMRSSLRGLRRNEYGFEALTPRRREFAAEHGDDLLVERATLEDIMVMFGDDRLEDGGRC